MPLSTSAPARMGFALHRKLGFAQAGSGLLSGAVTPFFGAWLAWRGLSPGALAAVMSLGLLLRGISGPVSGVVADARNDRREMMILLYGVTLLGYALLCFVKTPLAVFLTAVPALVCFGTATPLLESVCVRLSERFGYDYGRVRLFATVSFLLANVLTGLLITWYGFWTLAVWLAGTAAICVTAALALPAPPPEHPRHALSTGLKTTLGETRELLRSGPFLIFLAASSFDQASHAFYYAYGGLHWHELGYSGFLIGLLWPLGAIPEVFLLSMSLRVSRLVGPVRLLLLGGLGCVLRWTILAFDLPLPVVIASQFLHGLTFACAHIGAMYFILRAVPPRLAATAQSLYYMLQAGLLLGVATYASGLLYADVGGRAYLLMTAMGVVSMGFSFWLARCWHGGRVIQATSDEHCDVI